MKVIKCSFCTSRGFACDDYEFDDLPEGRFKLKQIEDLANALYKFVEDQENDSDQS